MSGEQIKEKIPRKILTVIDVEKKLGITRLTMWRLERKGQFPLRIKLTGTKIGWLENELDAWIDKRPRGIRKKIK